MRPKRIIPFALFVLLMIALPLLLLKQFFPIFSPARPLMNRFVVRSLAVDRVKYDSTNQRGGGVVSAVFAASQLDSNVGIRIRMDLDFATDSTKSKSYLLSLPGGDGALDPITSINWESHQPNQPTMSIHTQSYRALRLASIDDRSTIAQSGYASRPAVNIPNLDSIAAWLNTGRNVPSTLEGKIAFYIWPDSADLVRLATSQAQLRMTFQSGKTMVAALPHFRADTSKHRQLPPHPSQP